MLEEFLEEETESKENYPQIPDTEFTPDEVESIKRYKENLQRKLDKNRSVLRALEQIFWGITSYSLARFLILNIGIQGINLAIASITLINQIVNRDCLDNFNISREHGELKIDGMSKLIKFIFSTIITAFLVWGALGDFLQIVWHSEQTYQDIHRSVEEFNKLPDTTKKDALIIGGVFGIAILYVLADSKRR